RAHPPSGQSSRSKTKRAPTYGGHARNDRRQIVDSRVAHGHPGQDQGNSPNPLPRGEREPEIPSAKSVVANSTVLGLAWPSSRSPRRSDRRIRQGDDPGEKPEQPAEDDTGQEPGDDQERDPEHPVHRPENEGFSEVDQAT